MHTMYPMTVELTDKPIFQTLRSEAQCIRDFNDSRDSAIHTRLIHIAILFIDCDAETVIVDSCI